MNKSILAAVVGATVLLSVGVSAQSVPYLVGKWTGSVAWTSSSEGYTSNVPCTCRILDQEGPLFRATFRVQGQSGTNYVVGNLLTSKAVPGAWDVGMAVTGDDGTQLVGSGLLVTNTTPWSISRLQFIGFNGDVGVHGNFLVRGKLTKQ
jgi:hypothetical protein